MVPRDYQALSARRAARAETLAARYEPAREALLFYAGLARLQARVAAILKPEAPSDAVLAARPWLVELVLAAGPELLREAASVLDDDSLRLALADWLAGRGGAEPRSFFARVLLQPWAALHRFATIPSPPEDRCPRCAQPPQAGCLRPSGEGEALWLVCSLCLAEWSFPRFVCPACGIRDERKISYLSAAGYEHLRTQACEACRCYFHSVRPAKDPEAIADVDEIAALALDVWMQEKGWRKLQPNLVGM